MEKELKDRINAFLEKQGERGVKRNEIARSLFFKGYSERQVAEIMDITSNSAHAMKFNGRKEKKELKNYLKGNAVKEFNPFYKDCYELVGKVVHQYNMGKGVKK